MSKDFKPPKHWTTWFISDIHFGHKNVINYCNRPFTDVDNMKEKIIENWNKLVRPDDLCIFVGDIFFYHTKEEMKATLSRMRGVKILIKGNHDLTPREMMSVGFTLCVESMTMKIADEEVVISHYPFRMKEWLYRYVKIKSKVFKFLNKIGIKAPLVLYEKYHERRPIDNGGFLIHGHTHSTNKVNSRMIHVGVDAWNYKPVNIQQISNIINEIKKNGPKTTKDERNDH